MFLFGPLFAQILKKGHLVLIFPVFTLTKIMPFSCLPAALPEPDLSELEYPEVIR